MRKVDRADGVGTPVAPAPPAAVGQPNHAVAALSRPPDQAPEASSGWIPGVESSSSRWQLPASGAPASLGGGHHGQRFDVAAFEEMSAEHQRASANRWKAERTECEDRILKRSEELQRRWETMPPGDQARALREFETHSEELEAGLRAQVDAHVARAEDAQARIQELQEHAGQRDAHLAFPAEPRKNLARELAEARLVLSQEVVAAVTLVDEAGLRLELLALSEQVIDPSAPRPGERGSLLSDMRQWFLLIYYLMVAAAMDETQRQKDESRKNERRTELERLETERLRADRFRSMLREKLEARRRRSASTAL